ncbi:MAG: radical SAM protein [Elusimicrobiota bacterium]|jgi:MoaA/NifB/PqqE/SkfB family radical SAM enzyme|nr:radical SAM protein [Elusimicrobiota bacterium]
MKKIIRQIVHYLRRIIDTIESNFLKPANSISWLSSAIRTIMLPFKILRFIPRAQLYYLNIHLTEHCNLNCAYCDHFSPLAKEEFLDIETFENDLKRMAQLTNGYIKTIYLFGGEPLLHKDIIQFAKICRQYFLRSTITFITNGTLLMKMNDDFWQICKECNIEFIISSYPIKIPRQEIKKKAQDYGIKAVFSEYKVMWRSPLKLSGTSGIFGRFRYLINFLKCPRYICTFLMKGKIYMCPAIANIRHFNAYFSKSIPVSRKDYIDIYEAQNIEDILKYLSSPAPFCAYCDVDNNRTGYPWRASQKKIEEWADIE